VTGGVRPKRLLGLILASVVVFGALVGCGSSSSAPVSLPAVTAGTTTPSPAPTSTPTAGVTSKKAELAAARAVVSRYYEIANDLRNHMNAAALAALMTDKCPCRAQVRAVRRAARSNEHYIDQARLNHLVTGYEGPSAAYVLVDFDASRGGLVTGDGRHVTTAPPAKGVKRVFRLEKIDGTWLINRIEAVS
jgi:hypothetical protein